MIIYAYHFAISPTRLYRQLSDANEGWAQRLPAFEMKMVDILAKMNCKVYKQNAFSLMNLS